MLLLGLRRMSYHSGCSLASGMQLDSALLAVLPLLLSS